MIIRAYFVVTRILISIFLFFFTDTATTEIYTLSLHDALPISRGCGLELLEAQLALLQVHRHAVVRQKLVADDATDRKSTRLNSSHSSISYAVFCLKKKIIKQ